MCYICINVFNVLWTSDLFSLKRKHSPQGNSATVARVQECVCCEQCCSGGQIIWCQNRGYQLCLNQMSKLCFIYKKCRSAEDFSNLIINVQPLSQNIHSTLVFSLLQKAGEAADVCVYHHNGSLSFSRSLRACLSMSNCWKHWDL